LSKAATPQAATTGHAKASAPRDHVHHEAHIDRSGALSDQYSLDATNFKVIDFASLAVPLGILIDADTACIFVVVFDFSKHPNEQEASVTRWLRYACSQSTATKPRVVLVGIHTDQAAADCNQAPIFFRRRLNKPYSSVVTFTLNEQGTSGIFLVNSVDHHDPGIAVVASVLTKLRHEITKQRPTHRPMLCVSILKAVAQACPSAKLITLSELKALVNGQTCDVHEDMFDAALRFLHSQGDIYYTDVGPLANYVVTDVKWLYNSLIGWAASRQTSILASTDEQESFNEFFDAAEAGLVNQALIPILEASRCQEAFRSIDIVDVLQHFRLCYRMKAEADQYVVKLNFPALRKDKLESSAWQNASKMAGAFLGLQFSCSNTLGMLPPGFFAELQFQLYQDFQDSINSIAFSSNSATVTYNNAVALVVLIDPATVEVRACNYNRMQKNSLALLLTIAKAVQRTVKATRRCSVIKVHYLSPCNLASKAQVDRILTYPLENLLHKRQIGSELYVGNTASEAVADIVGLTNDGSLRYVLTRST
jgi:hypothetical protein